MGAYARLLEALSSPSQQILKKVSIEGFTLNIVE
jgi:hypothetical protein